MRVRCIAELPDEAQTELLAGTYVPGKQAFSVQVGSEYLVYALDLRGRMPWIHIADEYEQLSPAPLCLFAVVDPRVPRSWEMRVSDDCQVTLGPAGMWREGFIEDLLARQPAALADFHRITSELAEDGDASG